MNELIPLTDNDGVQAVMGRDLHAFLESREPYTRWIARHIEKYGFVAGQDFMTKMSESTGGRPSEDHILSMDMAKELAMVQGNEKGKQARQYFIECERRAKQPTINGAELTRLELIQIALNAETERLPRKPRTKNSRNSSATSTQATESHSPTSPRSTSVMCQPENSSSTSTTTAT